MSQNLSSFTLDQVFLEDEYFSHVLTEEEELISLLNSEKFPTLSSNFSHNMVLCPNALSFRGNFGGLCWQGDY